MNEKERGEEGGRKEKGQQIKRKTWIEIKRRLRPDSLFQTNTDCIDRAAAIREDDRMQVKRLPPAFHLTSAHCASRKMVLNAFHWDFISINTHLRETHSRMAF
ncbi:hypothetical protein GN956_G6450 [Arapaima gigas]